MEEEFYSMYVDEEPTATSISSTPVAITDKGIMSELQVNGKKVMLMDASFVMGLENTIKNLENKILKLEREIKNLSYKVRIQDGNMSRVVRELDNKVSYE